VVIGGLKIGLASIEKWWSWLASLVIANASTYQRCFRTGSSVHQEAW